MSVHQMSVTDPGVLFYTLTVGKVRSPTLEAIAAAVTLWKLEEGTGADNRRAMSTPSTGDQDTKVSAAARNSFPQYPGGNFLAHAGTQYTDEADARFSMLGLLDVAQGDTTPASFGTLRKLRASQK